MTLTAVILFVIALMAVNGLVGAFLNFLNARSAAAHRSVPEPFKDFISQKDYSESVAYTLAKLRLDTFSQAYGFIVMSAVLVLGFLPHSYALLCSALGDGVWAQALWLVGVMIVLSLPDLPVELYSQFVIEKKFGFNKSTLSLWVADKLKGLVLMVILAVPLTAVLVWFFGRFPQTWWLWGFAVLSAFQIIMMFLYPRLIIPLFNKLTPLEDGELKNRLMDVAKRGGFAASAIFVMDGSRRSSHSNAFFTGFGKFRRIVLFDTLIEQLAPDELEAVLAHEIGHYKLGHIVRMIAVSFAETFVGFALMGYLARSAWFYEGFGFGAGAGGAVLLLLFGLFAGLFTFWLTPLANLFSRRHEYQADDFSRRLCGGASSLLSALRKLQRENRGNLTPHPLYSAFYYSHPTFLERQKALLEADKRHNSQTS